MREATVTYLAYNSALFVYFWVFMQDSYTSSTQSFETSLDFLRFGLSEMAKHALYFGHGTDNAWDDMYALIAGSLRLPLGFDPVLLHGRLTTFEKTHLSMQLHKRIQLHVPVAYLVQCAYFCELSFYVDERVLIPRSPLAELIQQQFEPWVSPDSVTRILDLCTGSGCIAIACCYAFPDAMVDAVDISRDALDVAAINRQNHALASQLTLIESDCFDTVPKAQYDIIVSNPPYVGRAEIETLPAEYHHEPVLALEAEQDGLSIVIRILHRAGAYLSEQGILVVEVGNSADALIAAYPDVPFTWLDFEHGGDGVFLLTAAQVRAFCKA
jgi:ribosomal protein L3 glutamine methyltransferase